jgi:hypothetical protein
MAISANYPSPVTVNGFSCRNCTEVDYAKKHIDPANPQAGPFGMNAPEKAKKSDDPLARRGALEADRATFASYAASGAMAASNAIGTTVDRFG